MKKKIWITSLVQDKNTIQDLMKMIKRYGLDVDGHFWEDDLEKMAWMKPRSNILEQNVAMWAILGSQEDFENPSIRYGLSALCATVQAKKGLSFPVSLFLTLGQIDPSTMPTPLRGAEVYAVGDATVGAKIVAKVHGSPEQVSPDYRFDIYGNAQIGQWFEVGPVSGPWEGAMFGVDEGEITFQAVGPKDRLPSTSTLNYPMKGLKLSLGDTEYTAWAVKNPIDTDTSYFVKVEGFPGSIVFGSFSESDAAEVFVYKLK